MKLINEPGISSHFKKTLLHCGPKSVQSGAEGLLEKPFDRGVQVPGLLQSCRNWAMSNGPLTRAMVELEIGAG